MPGTSWRPHAMAEIAGLYARWIPHVAGAIRAWWALDAIRASARGRDRVTRQILPTPISLPHSAREFSDVPAIPYCNRPRVHRRLRMWKAGREVGLRSVGSNGCFGV